MAQQKKLTLSQMLETVYDKLSPNWKSSQLGCVHRAVASWEAIIGVCQVEEIDIAKVQEYREVMITRGHHPLLVKQYLRSVLELLRQAKRVIESRRSTSASTTMDANAAELLTFATAGSGVVASCDLEWN